MLENKENLVFRFFPRNYLLRNPLTGGLVMGFFLFSFALLYRPLGAHAGLYFGYELTMAFYAMAAGLSSWLGIKGLSRIALLSDPQSWNLLKELVSILCVLIVVGMGLYFAGFLLEESANRFNISTFADSVVRSMLAGIIPFLVFTLFGIIPVRGEDYLSQGMPEESPEKEQPVHISSQLKKEELSFYPSEFVYAESDSNYVVFYLQREGRLRKEIIRNSITNIEIQLSSIAWIMRVHRAYIINMKRVKAKKGNMLGYRLKLEGADVEIPVSRNKSALFKEEFARLNRF